MVYYNINVFLTIYIVFIAGIFYIRKKPIHLAIFTVISESLIKIATFPCNESPLFYQVLAEVNRKKQHIQGNVLKKTHFLFTLFLFSFPVKLGIFCIMFLSKIISPS